MKKSLKTFRAKLSSFSKSSEEEEGGKGSGAPPGWGKFREEKLKGRKVPNPDRGSSRKEVTVETAMRKSPAVKKKVMEEYKKWREQGQDKQDKGSKGTKSTKDVPSKSQKSKGKAEKSKAEKSKGPNKEFDESRMDHLSSYMSEARSIAKINEGVVGDSKLRDQVEGYSEDNLDSFIRNLASEKKPKDTDKTRREIEKLVADSGADVDVGEALDRLERQFFMVQNNVFDNPPEDSLIDSAAAAYAAQTLLDAVKHVHGGKKASQRRFRAKLSSFSKSSEEEGGGKGSGAPPGWGEFREEKLKGRKVPNPDRDSSRKEVSVETAMRKDPSLKAKVMKEYKEWAKKRDEKKPPSSTPSKKPKLKDLSDIPGFGDLKKLSPEKQREVIEKALEMEKPKGKRKRTPKDHSTKPGFEDLKGLSPRDQEKVIERALKMK